MSRDQQSGGLDLVLSEEDIECLLDGEPATWTGVISGKKLVLTAEDLKNE